MIKERNLALAALVTVAVLAACGGGGGGGGTTLPTTGGGVTVTPTPAGVTATAQPGQTIASVSITLKKGTFSQAVRRTQAIGTGTQSIVFTLLQQNGASISGSPQAFGLTASSAGCTVNGGGDLSCTLPVSAPIGSDVFLAQTFSGANGTGSLTGSGAMALTVGINTANTAQIVLNAQVNSVFLVAGSSFIGYQNVLAKARGRGAQSFRRPNQIATPTPAPFLQSTPIFVVAVDSSNNTILNPSAYSSPIYLQLSYLAFFFTPDVTLSVTYAANDPSPCTPGGTASATNFFDSFPICSPSDTLSIGLNATGGNFPAPQAIVYAYPSASLLIPVAAPSTFPSTSPSAPPNSSSVTISVGYPTPAPTGSVGTLPVTGQ